MENLFASYPLPRWACAIAVAHAALAAALLTAGLL